MRPGRARVRGIGQRTGGLGFLTQVDGRWFIVGLAAVRDPALPNLPAIGALGFVANLDGGTFPNHVHEDGKGHVFAVNKSRGEDDPKGDRITRIAPKQAD